MAWIGKSHGVFKLHQSDSHCGSFLSLPDAAEILEVNESAQRYIHSAHLQNMIRKHADIHPKPFFQKDPEYRPWEGHHPIFPQ